MPDEFKDIEIPEPVVINPPEGYSEKDWAGLTPGEKEIALDEISNPEGEVPPITKEEIKEEEPAPEKKDEGGPPAPEPKPEEKLVEATPVAEIMSDEDLLSHKFIIEDKIDPGETIPIPDDIQDKIDEIDEKFDSGDIDSKEHRDKLRELDRQATARYLQAKRAEQGDILWDKEQALFFKYRPIYLGVKMPDGTFQSTEDTEIVYGALVGALKVAQRQGLSGMAALVKADQIVKKKFGPKETPPAPAKKADEKPPAKMPEEYVNLGDLPAAGKNAVEGTFDSVDKLPGKRQEEYFKKHPEQLDRYIEDLGRA